MLAVQPQQADRNPLVAPLVRQLPNAEGVLQNLGNARPVATVQKGVCSTVCGAIKTFVLKIFAYIGRFFAFLCSCGRRQQNNVENNNNIDEARRRRQRPEREDNERPVRNNSLINEPNPIPYRSPNVPHYRLEANEYPNIAAQFNTPQLINRSQRALLSLGEERLRQINNMFGRLNNAQPVEQRELADFYKIVDGYNPTNDREAADITNAAEHMIFDRRGLCQRPATIVEANNDPAIDNINIDDLMTCFDTAYADEPRNQAGQFQDRVIQAMRGRIQDYTNFITERRRNDPHHFAEYTRLIQKSTRILIHELRKPPRNIPAVDEAYRAQKKVTFVNLSSVMEDVENHDGGCHPRRFNEIDKCIRYLQGTALGPPIPNMGESSYKLFHTLAMLFTEDKENIIFRTLQGTQFHVISPARTLVGDEYGLHYHPVRDEYHNVGGQPADVYREILDDQYRPPVMIKNTLDRLTNEHDLYIKDILPRVLAEIIERLPADQREYAQYQLDNPGAPNSFYDAPVVGVYEGLPRPNACMVRFVLQHLRFLMRDPDAPPEAPRVIPAQFREQPEEVQRPNPPQQPVVQQQPGALRDLTPAEQLNIALNDFDAVNTGLANYNRDIEEATRGLEREGLQAVFRNRFTQRLETRVSRRAALEARLPQLEAGRLAVPRPMLDQIAQLNPQNINQFINAREALIDPIQERLRAAQENDRIVIQLELDTEYATLQLARARRAELNPANEE